MLFPDITTRRGLHNIHYQTRALEFVHALDDERLRWLSDTTEEIMAGRGKMRRAILQELGRVENDDDMREIALELCRIKPTAKDARTMIRQWRGATRKQADALDLANMLIAAINDYLHRFPQTTWEQVRLALATAAYQVPEAEPAPEDRGCEAPSGPVDAQDLGVNSPLTGQP
jgi:hypothetical protein